jgi:alanyl-tRNA synthetase
VGDGGDHHHRQRRALRRARHAAPRDGLVVHLGTVTEGSLRAGEAVTLRVDVEARDATRRNHSATHLLHWALRKVLGPHAQQKGSKVGPTGLRFDYAASRALTDDEVARIEDLVNREVLANVPVRTEVTTQAEARARGAMMIFEEKYGDAVRMLHIGHESVELCGGTHAAATGDIGMFKVVSDANVGAGVRRIEAVTGLGALGLFRAQGATLQRAADALKAPVGELEHPHRQGAGPPEGAPEARSTSSSVSSLTGGGERGRRGARGGRRDGGRGPRARGHEDKAMREYADHLRDKYGPAVVVLGAVTPDGKALLVVAVSKELTDRFHAGKLVGQLAALVGGRGGGRPDMAGAGGPDGAKLDEALQAAWALVS